MISSHSKSSPSKDPKLKKQLQEQAQFKAELRAQTKELLMVMFPFLIFLIISFRNSTISQKKNSGTSLSFVNTNLN